MTATEIVETARALGIELRPREGDQIGASPRGRLPLALREAIDAHRADVITELRRLSDPARLCHGEENCPVCGVVGTASADGQGGSTCWRCAEWRLEGCQRFTVLHGTDDATEASFGACLSCGASCALHGNPASASWRRVADPQDVQLVAVRYVLAAATAIMRDAS